MQSCLQCNLSLSLSLSLSLTSLNTVREICSRCPLVMSHELLQDLTAYKSYRDKSVAMAARSLIQLFRTINPSLLSRKDKVKMNSFKLLIINAKLIARGGPQLAPHPLLGNMVSLWH